MSADKIETFEMGVLERVTLSGLLNQQQGNLTTVQVLNKFVADLSLTEEELAAWEVRQDGEALKWNPTLATAKSFAFTPWRLSKIREVLKALDARGAVHMQLLPLFRLFLPTTTTSQDAELAAEFAAVFPAHEEEREPTPIFGGESAAGKQE